MARPVRSTPVIKGRDAERIQREIVQGTRNTPERIQQIREADAIYRRVAAKRAPRND